MYSSTQTVADIEAIREAVGVERLAVYGTSYGTELAQAYVTRYPDHVSRLVLDAPIDVALGGFELREDRVRAASISFDDLLDTCAGTPRCAADIPTATLAVAYDSLRAALAAQPVTTSYFGSDGASGRTVVLTAGKLEQVVDVYLANPNVRRLLLRALTSASVGDLGPLARMWALTRESGDQESSQTRGGFSVATYYSTQCADHPIRGDEVSDRIAVYIDSASTIGANRVTSPFFNDLPCVFWSAGLDIEPTPDWQKPTVPSMVIASRLDPIASFQSALAVAARIGAQGVWVEGSEHGVIGREGECVVEAVTAFLLERATGDRSCPGSPTPDYLPLPQRHVADYADVLDAMTSVEFEITSLPEIATWNGGGELTAGCRDGGQIRARRVGGQDHYSLVDCAMLPGWPMTGEGVGSIGGGLIELAVSVPDGRLAYTKSRGTRRVEGTLDGQYVRFER